MNTDLQSCINIVSCADTNTHAHIYISSHIYAHIHARTHARTRTHIHILTHTFIHAHIHAHTHTRTHAHTHTRTHILFTLPCVPYRQGGAKKSPDEDRLPAEYLSSPLSQQPQVSH